MREPAVVDTVLRLSDETGSPAGSYHLRIYHNPEGGLAVVLGELTDNTGPDVGSALQRLAEIVRRKHIPGQDQVGWFLYFPYDHAPGATDRFVRVEPESDGRPSTGPAPGREVSAVDVDRQAGTVVTRYLAADYTSFGVRPSRRAVAGWAELSDRLTLAGQPAVTVTEARAIVADMARTLSQMREVATCLAADVATGQGDRALAEPLAGPVQANLTSGVELTALAVEGSLDANSRHHPGEPTLAVDCVFNADLNAVGPALGVCHVRVYRPVGRTAVVIIGQLTSTPAVPVLGAARILIPLIRDRLLAGDHRPGVVGLLPGRPAR